MGIRNPFSPSVMQSGPPQFVVAMTGTPQAYHPQGSVLRGGHRVGATGDYEPWSPK